MHLLSLLAGAALACVVIYLVGVVRKRDNMKRLKDAAPAPNVDGPRSVVIVRACPIYVDGLMVAELVGARFTFTARSTIIRARTVVPVTGMDTDLVTLVRTGRPAQVACPLGDDFLASTGTFTMAEVISEEESGTLDGEFTFEGGRAISTERTNEVYADPSKLGPSGYTSVTVYGRTGKASEPRARIMGRWPEDIAQDDDVRPLIVRDAKAQSTEEAVAEARALYERPVLRTVGDMRTDSNAVAPN